MSRLRAMPALPGDLANRERAKLPKVRRGDRFCRLCARRGLESNRHSWHEGCAVVYCASMYRHSQIQWLLRRQRGLCATCDTVLGIWETFSEPSGDSRYGRVRIYTGHYLHGNFVRNRDPLPAIEIDHKVPLWRVALMEGANPLRYWLVGNLQALCSPCHRAKTKGEAAERAALKRPRVRLPLLEALDGSP